jgi:1,4-alpha-glucan branching enzyme
MITIQKVAEAPNGKARVRFSMPAVDCCGCLYLVGWFDEWDQSVYRMEPAADGGWSLSLELDTGCEYQYSFRTADGRWLSDAAATPSPAPLATRNSFIISSDRINAESWV